ncbi:CCR4-NOT core subunit cdc39, partial [Linderina pennispora]
SARVAKEVMSWLAYADDDRKDNVPVALALINERLLSTADEDARLARHIEGGFLQAIDYAVKFVRRAVVEGALPATAQTFPKAIQAFVALAQSGRAPQAVTQLLEDIQASQQASRTPRHSQDGGSQAPPEALQQQPQQQPQPQQPQQQPQAQQSQAQQSAPAEAAPVIPVAPGANATPSAPIIPASARSQEAASYQQILYNWTRVCEHPAASEAELTTLVQQLSQQVPLHDHDVSAAFFCANIESVVDFYSRSIAAARAGARAGGSTSGIGYQVADALAKLVVYLIKLGPKDSDGKVDIGILRIFLSSVVLVIVQTHATQPDVFGAHQRPL